MGIAKGGFLFTEAAVNTLEISDCKDQEFNFLNGGRKLQKGNYYIIFPQFTFDKEVMGNKSATIVAWEVNTKGGARSIDMGVSQFRRSFFKEGGDAPDINAVLNDQKAKRASESLSVHNLEGVFPLRGVVTASGKKAKAIVEPFICVIEDDRTYWEPTIKRRSKSSTIYDFETVVVKQRGKDVEKVKVSSKAYPFIRQVELEELCTAVGVDKAEFTDLLVAPAVYDKLAYKG